MGGDDLYTGIDELTGLDGYFKFSDQLDHRMSSLRRSGKNNSLIMVCASESASEEEVREIADYLKGNFIRLCRYEKKDYAFLGLCENSDSCLKIEQDITYHLQTNYPSLDINTQSMTLTGEESLDDITMRLEKCVSSQEE